MIALPLIPRSTEGLMSAGRFLLQQTRKNWRQQMASFAAQTGPGALHFARLPGDLGPVVRCTGELTLATRESLKRELDLLISIGHSALILNVTGCRVLDVDGALLILDTCKRL